MANAHVLTRGACIYISSHIDSVSHSLYLQSADDVTIDHTEIIWDYSMSLWIAARLKKLRMSNVK